MADTEPTEPEPTEPEAAPEPEPEKAAPIRHRRGPEPRTWTGDPLFNDQIPPHAPGVPGNE